MYYNPEFDIPVTLIHFSCTTAYLLSCNPTFLILNISSLAILSLLDAQKNGIEATPQLFINALLMLATVLSGVLPPNPHPHGGSTESLGLFIGVMIQGFHWLFELAFAMESEYDDCDSYDYSQRDETVEYRILP